MIFEKKSKFCKSTTNCILSSTRFTSTKNEEKNASFFTFQNLKIDHQMHYLKFEFGPHSAFLCVEIFHAFFASSASVEDF